MTVFLVSPTELKRRSPGRSSPNTAKCRDCSTFARVPNTADNVLPPCVRIVGGSPCGTPSTCASNAKRRLKLYANRAPSPGKNETSACASDTPRNPANSPPISKRENSSCAIAAGTKNTTPTTRPRSTTRNGRCFPARTGSSANGALRANVFFQIFVQMLARSAQGLVIVLQPADQQRPFQRADNQLRQF